MQKVRKEKRKDKRAIIRGYQNTKVEQHVLIYYQDGVLNEINLIFYEVLIF